MAKSAKRSRTFTKQDAINLHVDANNSDPFASQRMTQHLNKFPRDTKRVAEEAQRILDARNARINRRAVADWLPAKTIVRLTVLRDRLQNATKKKTRCTRKTAAVMQAAA